MPRIALIASPLLGASVWRPVAERLGRPVLVVPSLPRPPRSPEDVLAHLLGSLPPDEDLIVVPHSNAGAYLPELVTARRVVAYVLVDARMPPADAPVPLGSAALAERRRQLADEDGLLPPWTRWWDGDPVGTLVPDRATMDRIERDQRRLPLAYFEQTLPARPGWDSGRGAYLALSPAYAADSAEASRRGWPVTTLDAGHLHMLMRPDEVAGALDGLVTAAGSR